MKRLLKIIPTEKLNINEKITFPLSKKDSLILSKKNLLLNGSKKDLNTFLIQSFIYLSLAYNVEDFNVVLIDFNKENKALYKLSSLDTIKYIFLEPSAIDLSVFLDGIDKGKRTLFFVFENEELSSYPDYTILLEDTFLELSKNPLFSIISLYEGKKREPITNTLSLSLEKTKFLLEKDFIPDFFLKINQEINFSIENVYNYRLSRLAYIKIKRLF